MCGRYAISTSPSQLAKTFGVLTPPPNFAARYNAAPTQDLPVIRFNPETKQRTLDVLRWGLVPVWAKDLDIGSRAINAKMETIQEKPMFRDAYAKRRCLVPADAFYEWKMEGKEKQPYAIGMRDRDVFALAGIWERWKKPDTEEIIRTFSIITGEPNSLVAPIHDRMPIILPADAWPTWLGESDAKLADIESCMQTFPVEAMEAWSVSKDVGNVRNDAAHLLNKI